MSDGTGAYQYFMIANESNQPIGYINIFSFDEIKKEAELGIMIGNRNYQGKGVASYALNKALVQIQAYRDLNRVYVETNVDNESAIRLFERVGFIKVSIEDWGKGVFFQTMEKYLK
jgi:RimJ/RimL family protein N-acetyltransferase